MSTGLPIPVSHADDITHHTPSGLREKVIKCDIHDNPGLPELQLRAIQLILKGETDFAVAAALNIKLMTLLHWKTRDEAFRAVLANLRAQLRDSFADRCQANLITAVNVLLQIAGECDDEKLRLRAAEVLYRNGFPYLHSRKLLKTEANNAARTAPAPANEPLSIFESLLSGIAGLAPFRKSRATKKTSRTTI
jgi:hypothetical protein